MRRALFAVLVSALAVAAAGCGGAKDALDPVAAAAENSASAGGYRVQMEMSVSARGESGSMTASGAFDGEQGELTLDMTELLAQAGAPAGMSGEWEMIFLREDGGPALYVRVPFVQSFLPAGKEWIRVDADDSGEFEELLGQAGTQNPAETLSMLRAVGEVEEVGSEVVDGVATTHYRASIDPERAAAEQGVSDEATKRFLEQIPPGTTVPVEVWIGEDDGLPYRFELAYEMTEGGETASLSMTMTMTDWGSDVTVAAPPADAVFDASGLAAQGSSGP